MSRHSLTPRDDDGLDVVVGWDAPLLTFFAQVLRPPENNLDDDAVLLWVGGDPGEICTPEDLAPLLAPWAELPADVVAQLHKDRRQRPGPEGLQIYGLDSILRREVP